MKYFQWSIGTTSVRNPDRLRDGLQILKKNFEGQPWNTSQQQRFFELLRGQGVYEMEEDKHERMTSKRKQEHGRKWVSVLNQLGFCFAYKSSSKLVIITQAGNTLLANPEIENEIFLRQLLKYQKPCALPKQNGPSFKNVSILPFLAGLKITYELNGLSKEEISIFLNATVQMEDIAGTIKQIQDYRVQKSQIAGRVKGKELYVKTQVARLEGVFSEEINKRTELIKELISKYKQNASYLSIGDGKHLLAQITRGGKGANTKKAKRAQQQIIESVKNNLGLNDAKNKFLEYFIFLKIDTLRDYADLTIRYLRKSGLFSVSREKLITIAEKEDLIKSLLSQKWDLVPDKEYLDYLWSDSLPTLPSDNLEYLGNHLATIIEREKLLYEKVGGRESMKLIGKDVTRAENIPQLKQQVNRIEQNLRYLREIEFYYLQREEKQIDDIINFYALILNKEILGGNAYYPAYLEWNTWRAFLSIDALKNKPYEARNFKIDDELQPIDHAPGNRADMVFEYEDFVLVTEVTLQTGANQHSAEAEPVQRHVARIQAEKKGKDVFGLFIAPAINTNTFLTFYNNRQYSINNEILNLTIVPFSIDETKTLLSIFKQKRFSTQDMKDLFILLQAEMQQSKDALTWGKKIPSMLHEWQENL